MKSRFLFGINPWCNGLCVKNITVSLLGFVNSGILSETSLSVELEFFDQLIYIV